MTETQDQPHVIRRCKPGAVVREDAGAVVILIEQGKHQVYLVKKGENSIMMKRCLLFLTIMTILGLLVAASQAAPAKLEKVSLRLAWIYNAQFAGPMVAKEKGFYEEVGLDVDLRPGGRDLNSIPLVASGADTFGLHDMNSLVFARYQKMPLVAVACYFPRHPACVFALKSSGIKEPKDLVGKTLGYKVGGPWTLTRAMLKKEGIPLDSLTVAIVPSDITPLLTGKIDAMTGMAHNEPVAAQTQGFDVTVIQPFDYGIRTGSDVLFTTEKLIKDKPELVRRMVQATCKGWLYAKDHQEEAVDIVLKYNKDLNKEHQRRQLAIEAEKYLWSPETREHGIGWMSLEAWEQTQDILFELGEIPGKTDMTKAFTNEFLK